MTTWNGQMDHAMMGSGKMAWLVAMADLSMLKEMFMRVLGMKIKQMVLVFILITMAVSMKANGLTTNSM